ncbi:hypothetical protein VTK73DRAFT_3684 [Phialemonium thermophilum]|uniref:Uncharacterized protein n=1 Tax=Phialemonium thermophilum TaxID=223376 RepID=A0ABR3VFU4_9PEZI
MGLPWMARSADRQASTPASLSKVTKPNPRGRPVSLSIIRVASTTRPNWAKYSRNSWSVVSWLTPPTKILDVFSCSSRGMARFGSIWSRGCSLTMTMFTVLGSLKVRKPKPLERPVALSLMTVHSTTSPNCEK